MTNFNPRPREEGDKRTSAAYILCRISIHALVKRATDCIYNPYDYVGISIHALVKRATSRPSTQRTWKAISIHALVKRATQQAQSLQNILKYFNPRPREEGDYRKGKTLVGLFRISIHALVKRATPVKQRADLPIEISIHALVKRATCNRRNFPMCTEFQSTPS